MANGPLQFVVANPNKAKWDVIYSVTPAGYSGAQVEEVVV